MVKYSVPQPFNLNKPNTDIVNTTDIVTHTQTYTLKKQKQTKKIRSSKNCAAKFWPVYISY